jgi:hypothetical protein
MYPEHVVEIADLKGVNLGASKRAALDAMKEKLRKDQKMQEMKDRIAQLEQELNK